MVVIDINAIEAIGEDQVDPCGPGDYNCNGVVDAADYTVWRDTFGSTTILDADGNGDGTIDLADLAVWNANFGISYGPSVSVPEPGAAMLALVAAAGWFARRKQS